MAGTAIMYAFHGEDCAEGGSVLRVRNLSTRGIPLAGYRNWSESPESQSPSIPCVGHVVLGISVSLVREGHYGPATQPQTIQTVYMHQTRHDDPTEDSSETNGLVTPSVVDV